MHYPTECSNQMQTRIWMSVNIGKKLQLNLDRVFAVSVVFPFLFRRVELQKCSEIWPNLFPFLSRFAEHTRGLHISGWSCGYEYDTAKLHSSPDDPSPYTIKTWTPHPFIFAKSPPSPSHDDARRTLNPSWNDHVSTEPYHVKFCRPQCWWTAYGHPCPIV